MPVFSALLISLTFQEFIVRAIVSLAILSCAMFVILSPRFKTPEKHWAFGVIGTILGYWLRP
jgi:hypothetical protein